MNQNMTSRGSSRVVILGTGGTIAGRAATASDNVGYEAAQVSIEQLIADVPELLRFALVTEQVAQVDSKDMSMAVWQRLLERVAHHLRQADVRGVVITHGTDTLEETAYFLHRALSGAGLASKPVVLTCAMRPASSHSPDGPQNLLDAVAVAHDASAQGVVVVCAGVVHSAVAVQKINSYRLDAFSSGEFGAVGFVEEGAVRWSHSGRLNPAEAIENKALFAIEKIVSAKVWPQVEIVVNHAGADGRLVDLLLQAHAQQRATAAESLVETPFEKGGLQGLIVAGTGNGTVHVALQAALLRAQAAGVEVWRTSRCAFGRVMPTQFNDVLPGAGGLSPVKARVALMVKLLTEH